MMNRAFALVSLGVASVAIAQEWRFELSEPVLSPASPSTFVTLSIDHDPADYAFAVANLSVHATEAGWSDLITLIMQGPPYPSGQSPGSISGGDVTGITVGQLAAFGWIPTPGRIDVWRGTFTATDFSSARTVDLRTQTTRFEVYTDPFPAATREPRTPIEGHGQIQIVPAPAGVAMLGLAGALIARRRSPQSRCRRPSR